MLHEEVSTSFCEHIKKEKGSTFRRTLLYSVFELIGDVSMDVKGSTQKTSIS